MTQSLARYHARSPRYILNTQDDSLIRVAGPRQTPWEEGTEIKNVSLTGLAFTAPEDLCPILGEVIRIQFVIPGGKQMASHAIVTRIEEERPEVMTVAVHFYKLEMSHRIMLAQGLSRRVRERLQKKNLADLESDLEERSLAQLVGPTVLMVTSLWMWCSIVSAIASWHTHSLLDLLPYFVH